MANPLLSQRRVLAAKLETTFGTAIALTATDAGFRVMDRDLQIIGEVTRRENQAGLGYAANASADKHTELSFKTLLHGKGSAAAPTWMSTFMPCVGMPLTSTTAATTSDTTNWKSLTSGAYIDGVKILGRGMMGNLKLNFTAGKPVELEWNFMGGYEADPTDTAILSGMSYDAVLPPVFAGTGSLTLGAATTYCKISKMTIDIGNVVALREDPNSAGGYLGAFIGNRTPTVTLDPEVVAMATKSFGADFTANTEIALSAAVGTVANNIFTVTIGAIQLGNYPKFGDRNGKLINDLTYLVNNDSISLAQT